NLSDIENKAYDKVAFDGDFKMSNIRYHAKDMPKTKIESIALQAKPSLVTISSSGIELGSSQLSLSGLIVDPLHFALKDGNLNGKIVVKSELLNLDEWNTSNSPPSNTQSTTSVNIDRYKTSNI
ncbi:MAG TPA: hypothetical protein PKD85_16595, partial [Saprospiraceae bacterium]|nr:hypothetical protein [Saprospiraceae bacterium]